MKTDMEIRTEGISILMKYMGNIEAERFISLIHREKSDYTKWRTKLFEEKTIREISTEAMELRTHLTQNPSPALSGKGDGGVRSDA